MGAVAGAGAAGPNDPMTIELRALPELPELRPGDDLAAVLARPLEREGIRARDVLVISHKVVSKCEGAVRALGEVEPGERARSLGVELDRDPRLVQVVLDESRAVLRAESGVLICETRHGMVCASAGVDASNAPGEDVVVLLPVDPDGSARALRSGLGARLGVAPGVVIADSFGRAWRIGQCDVAIGCAGIRPMEDWRGRVDRAGRPLRATWIAVADELAAAADLARGKDSGEPAVVVRGVGHLVSPDNGPGAAALRRPAEQDLFR